MADDGFAVFYASSYRRLLGQLFAVTGDLAEAENALQEAYARAFARWSRVGAYDLPEAWVRRVAINLAAMANRSLRRRARALLRLGPPPLVPELSPDVLDLRDALAALPLDQRQVIVLHHLVGLPVEEVARELRLAATDLRGAGTLAGHWFGKTDATVYLDQDADPAERKAVRDRLEALDVVDKVYFESSREAYDRLRQLYRAKSEVYAKIDPTSLPESFRVRLGTPQQFKQLVLALCRPGKSFAGKPRCVEGIQSVQEDVARLKPLLVGKKWLAVADVTVVLPDGTSDARRRAVQARLETIDGVRVVTYESPDATYRQLPEKVRKDPLLASKLAPATLPASFRVTLEEPKRVDAFHRALCGSLRTGDCRDGLVVLEHPRR